MDDAARTMTAGEVGRGEPERISPLFNDLFLRLFGRQESKGATRSLVNAILHLAGVPAIGDVRELRCDVTSAGGIAMRSARVDVLVVSDDGAVVDLEAQRERANVDNKILFYASKLLCEHTPKGGPRDYSKLPQVIVIMLVEGWTRFEGRAYLHVGCNRWESEEGIENGSDRVLYVIAELDKVARRYTVDDAELATIREFAEHYNIALGDPDLKRTYERYCEARTEYNDIIREGKLWERKQGRKEGRREGAEATLIENTRNIMKALHYTAQQAFDILKVPEADRPRLMKLL